MLKRMCPRACLSASKYLLVVWLWISHIISRCLIIFIWKNGDINHTSEGCCEDLKRMMNIKYKKYTSHRISAQNITYHCYYYSLKASGINSLAFCLLYGPVLTTVHEHLEDHSLDYTVLCWQSNVSAFQNTSRFVEAFLPRSKCLLVSWLQSPSTLIL